VTLASTKLNCLVTRTQRREQVPHSHYAAMPLTGVKPLITNPMLNPHRQQSTL